MSKVTHLNTKLLTDADFISFVKILTFLADNNPANVTISVCDGILSVSHSLGFAKGNYEQINVNLNTSSEIELNYNLNLTNLNSNKKTFKQFISDNIKVIEITNGVYVDNMKEMDDMFNEDDIDGNK